MRRLLVMGAAVAWLLVAAGGAAQAAGHANVRPYYLLPWNAGAVGAVEQGWGGDTSHGEGEDDEFAWDFSYTVNFSVRAARTGVVLALRENQGVGECDNSYGEEANYVRIGHPDGTESLYYHLKQNSVTVSVGQWVTSYQIIGLSDESGYTCGDHVHFQVQQSCTPSGVPGMCQSIRASFQDPDVLSQVDDGVPVHNGAYRSGNHVPGTDTVGVTGRVRGLGFGSCATPTPPGRRI
ncbi:MAG: M23 family metallopeptidase [Actinomycetota bacterium]